MSPPNPKPAGTATLFEVWREGVRVFGRFLWFLFFFIILLVPLGMIASNMSPGERALFDKDGLNPLAAILLVAQVVYLPFAAYFSARWSNQLLGAKPRNVNVGQTGAADAATRRQTMPH